VVFTRKLLAGFARKLTADETQFPIYDFIKDLPSLMGYTQIRAQNSGAEGQNGSQPVAEVEQEEIE
jgi:hypothetical protein